MAGIVHFSEFFRYMEAAEHAFFRSLDLSVNLDLEGRLVSWPRASCSFDFKRPLKFEDEFEIHLSIERRGKKSVTFRSYIMMDGEWYATGRMTNVCCEISDKGHMQSMAIPEAVRKKLEPGLSRPEEEV
jgi:YbgC/YbaW family acyl-CoA thioester hydrolase